LFSRLASTTSLQTENNKLKRENLDLKKQLEKNHKNKPKQ